MELVVPAVRGPVRSRSLAALLQSCLALPIRNSVLLLVPAAMGDRQRGFHRDRLLCHPRVTNKN